MSETLTRPDGSTLDLDLRRKNNAWTRRTGEDILEVSYRGTVLGVIESTSGLWYIRYHPRHKVLPVTFTSRDDALNALADHHAIPRTVMS